MLTHDQSHQMLMDFLDEHNFLNLGIEYAIAQNPRELYDLTNIEVNNSYLGGHVNEYQLVFFIIDRIKDLDEFIKIAKHEICGHVFINKLPSDQKTSLLDSISNEYNKHNSNFSEHISRINNTQNYKNLPIDLKAEEIFAFIAQDIIINPHHRFIPFDAKIDGSTKENIENIIQNIAAGIRENRLTLQKDNFIDKSQDKGMSR